MRRREFITLIGSATMALPLAARAQQAGKVSRIGTLETGSAAGTQHIWQAFRERLRDLGFKEGENVAFEQRFADGKIERLPELAAELVRLKVDVIAAGGHPQTQAAKDATKTIPIVFATVGDPVRYGLVASLARPGGNITGASSQTLDLAGKRLELLREIVPGVSRFALLLEPSNISAEFFASDTKIAAGALDLSLQTIGVREANEFGAAFSAMRRERAGALIVAPSSLFLDERRRLAGLALENALPTVFPQRDYASAGGLLSYGSNFVDQVRRAAVFVAKILNGARPADLPVEQPTKFELVLNLKTAKALGLELPLSLLIRVDEVIE